MGYWHGSRQCLKEGGKGIELKGVVWVHAIAKGTTCETLGFDENI